MPFKRKPRNKYKYLNQQERFVIEKKLKMGIKIPQIAKDLLCGSSTIYNEIARSGQTPEDYNSLIAKNKVSERRINKKINSKI